MPTATEKERPALITLSEAAALLGISTNSARQVIEAGALEPVHIAGLTWARFRRADVERLINGEGSGPHE